MGIEFELPPVRCFISYRRDDNSAFNGVVDRLKSDLSGRFEAETGRKLDIFVDRDDIGWGDDWRGKVSESIERAMFFIPILTARYFHSQNCLDEFLAFHSNARQLGVSELIAPVVLSGMGKLADENASEVSKKAMSLNCRLIENAFMEGFESREWNSEMKRMVADLNQALERSEETLARREKTTIEQYSESDRRGAAESRFADSGVDVLELLEKIDALTAQFPVVTQDFTALGTLISTVLGADFKALSVQRQRVALLELAESIEEPAHEFSNSSGKLQEEFSKIDAQLRLMVEEIASMDSEEGRLIQAQLFSGFEIPDDLLEVQQAVGNVADALKMLAMMNVNLRRSIGPATSGVRALQASIDLFAGWSEFGA
ncbi:TIR domain-containing protein [Nocardia sp. SYP-A9097]|uniref:toll/interleukin-1 receptor domain-containing protein n=1 Tax=Nocardia sp. SYP-A9097 TaxID=2663237 RepID=UPI00129BC9AC|nr:toll/interleukin-1 receptor domain-containing protein [Nocardia sp. SYP-A9097]MRH88496.1 TIR domain-containing protein [Nocardia sp. SYP-A9097]